MKAYGYECALFIGSIMILKLMQTFPKTLEALILIVIKEVGE